MGPYQELRTSCGHLSPRQHFQGGRWPGSDCMRGQSDGGMGRWRTVLPTGLEPKEDSLVKCFGLVGLVSEDFESSDVTVS